MTSDDGVRRPERAFAPALNQAAMGTGTAQNRYPNPECERVVIFRLRELNRQWEHA